jgi:hypothetical protein
MPIFFRSVRSKKRKTLLTKLDKITKKEISRTFEGRVSPIILKSFQKIVKDWEHKPKFKHRKIIKPNRISLLVYPEGKNTDIFTYVELGTKPHKIRGSPRLKYKWGGKGSYVSKTLFRRISRKLEE